MYVVSQTKWQKAVTSQYTRAYLSEVWKRDPSGAKLWLNEPVHKYYKYMAAFC